MIEAQGKHKLWPNLIMFILNGFEYELKRKRVQIQRTTNFTSFKIHLINCNDNTAWNEQ